MKIEISRRSAIQLLGLGSVAIAGDLSALDLSNDSANVRASADFLTATLRWNYPNRLVGKGLLPYRGVLLEISMHEDMRSPIASDRLPDDANIFRVAVSPKTTYYWRLTPIDQDGKVVDKATTGKFNTDTPRMEDTDDDRIRYKNPRMGAHWEVFNGKSVVPFSSDEPLAPWYEKKSYLGPEPPHFDEVRERLPVPVLESEESLIELYWYCWKTFFDLWLFPPTAQNHQAVTNLVGLRSWGNWGSTVVWDTAFMLHFARYANLAYPFITAFDNCYARQHENGFICRESDSQNMEVYAAFPLNPPLFAWTEWEYFQISNDLDRLRRVLPPIVKHYEWYMKYQRRSDGLYWTDGFNEADDSPRNELMYYAASATSYQALSALYLAKIARQIGRADLVDFFTKEHHDLGQSVNEHFWDAKHSLYNDKTKDGRFITELEPGIFCKHVHMFWPLIAQIADDKGVEGLVAELTNPKSFYRYSGIPSLSADSKGYREDGQYWKGSVWPPVQCMVQEGLRLNGKRKLAKDLAQKYLKALVEAFQQQHTITENLAPDTPKGFGVKDFVGWGGIGPISNLIEYVLGFHVSAPENTVEWRIDRRDRHGISNLAIGKFTASFTCAPRISSSDPCEIEVESNGAFTLRLIADDQSHTEHLINPGRNHILSPRGA